MQRLAGPIMETLGQYWEVTSSASPAPAADLNYYVPFHGILNLDAEELAQSKHVVLYTHTNPGMEEAAISALARADRIICMSYAGRQELLDASVPREKLWMAYPGVNDYAMRRRIVGIVGTEQPNGRKNAGMLLDLAWNMDCKPFHFAIVGQGWDYIVEQARLAGMSVEIFESLDAKNMGKFYNGLDALLCTGRIEGGPLPLLEALACGVPVFSPDYGYGRDLLPSSQIYKGTDDLIEKLKALAKPGLERASTSSMFLWHDWVANHILVFSELLGVEYPLVADSGMPRYQQLLKIIDQRKPKIILEVGTFNGERASQMIQRAQLYNSDIQYFGYDLFDSERPGLWSKLAPPADYVYRRLVGAGAEVQLCVGNSRESLGRPLDIDYADLIYIDGDHYDETVRSDWNYLQPLINDETVVVFDDYCYQSPENFDGQGAQFLVQELAKQPDKWYVELLPEITLHQMPFGTLEIGMALIKRRSK